MEQDYLMRMLQTFFNALYAWKNGKQKPDDEQEVDVALAELYQHYLKESRAYFHRMETGCLIAWLSEEPDGLEKAQMLTALLYEDALLRDGATRKDLLEKSLSLYQHIQSVSKDFSIDRSRIMEDIEMLLQKI